MLAMKEKLELRKGVIELFGIDYLIDENHEIWVLDVNYSVDLTPKTRVNKIIAPQIVDSFIDMSLYFQEQYEMKKEIVEDEFMKLCKSDCTLLINEQR